jgi:nucleolar protein 53
MQVLTSDELGGGLRRLKPTAMLAAERFKSLQKRGLIEPRKPVAPKQKKLVGSCGVPALVPATVLVSCTLYLYLDVHLYLRLYLHLNLYLPLYL